MIYGSKTYGTDTYYTTTEIHSRGFESRHADAEPSRVEGDKSRMTASGSLPRTISGFAAATAAFIVTVSTPVSAVAEPGAGPETIATLIVQIASADQQLQQVGAQVQQRQEAVNKAIVDVQSSRDAVDAARRDVADSQRSVREATAAIAAAQQRFDTFAAAAYVQGPSGSYLTAGSPEELIATAGAGQTLQASFQTTMADLARAHTNVANKESAARDLQRRADTAADQAQNSLDTAVSTLRDTQQQFGSLQADVDRLAAQRRATQARLDAARPPVSASAHSAPAPADAMPVAAGDRWDGAYPQRPTPPASTATTAWDLTLPMVPSANIAGDPMAIVNMVLQISATSAQLTADMGRKFLTQLGILPAASVTTDPGITNGRIPRVYGRQASEYVIRRAMSQLGVPYSWGGGTAAGPSRGIDQGAGTVGFDCSGLYLYAFAGVGIKLPHYSGNQYEAGRKIPSSQMRRGDLIFYGPNASQHEAMYLGDGQMLEAPNTGSVVKVSPVRTSGMTPYVTRLIEY